MDNETEPPPWSSADQYDPMAAPFHDLLDFGEEFSFGDSVYEPDQGQDSNHQLSSELADSLHAQHLQQFTPPVSNGPHNAPPSGLDQAQSAHIGGEMAAANNYYDFSMSAFNQSTQAQMSFSAAQEQVFHSHTGVPPTPNSVEMHGDAARYLQRMDPQTRAFFEQRYQLRKEEAAFTPLVSPAVTPHDVRYQMPEYNTTVPGSYFSPLTSPALRAQQQERNAYQQSHYATSGSSAGTSPVDLDVDMLGEPATSQPDAGRRLRSNKKTGNRSAAASTRVRQSPIVKPSTRRKATLSSVIPPKEVSDLLEEVQRSKHTQPSSNALPLPRSRDGSEAESISPEPLSDMRPPPRPGSVTHSPAISAKGGNTFSPMNGASQKPSPATPASLMRLQQSPSFSPNLFHPQEMSPLLEELSLPEAATPSSRPSLSRLETAIQVQDEDQSTPRLPARKTLKLNLLSTPSGSVPLSMAPSPLMSAISSPTSPGFALNGARRIEAKGARNSKKRNSTSSGLVSPALRPKISPSIKPLLPEGATSDETHALLLASKSNYQNILDGTTVPGVNYPSSLSTNLTSKRTSHKIAEQGRRNRINTALLEMQTLLPSPQIKAKDASESKSPEGTGSGGGGGRSSTAAQQSNSSKAATVESAIEYIRKLQRLQQEKEEIISKKDEEVEALRRELASLRRGSSASTPTSVDEPKKEADAGREMVDAT